MGILFGLLRLFLFFFSCYGYIQNLRKSIRTEFCIGLLFSGISCVLFFAGILNLLRAAAWALFLFGLILAVNSVKQRNRIHDILCAGIVFYLLLLVLFPALLYGSEFTHYDNFSHWAIAARVMIDSHRFPNFQDDFIMFSSYPLGSACFIYYFTEIVGASAEWIQMYAQSILMAGMLTSLFVFCGKKLSSLLTAFFCLCLLCSNNSLFDLLVDNLLPIVALSGASFCLYYACGLKDRLFCLLPYVVFLVTIKNSGLLFSILLCGYIWTTLRREDINPKTWLIFFAVPIMTLVLWQAHVRQVFPFGMEGKHSLSLSYFKQIFNGKRIADIWIIVRAMVAREFSVSNRGMWVLITGILFWLIWKRLVSQPCREMRTTLLFAGVSYVLYQIGTLGMYLFSMPTEEAVALAAYGRYHQTIITFIAGLLLTEVMRTVQQTKDSDTCKAPPVLLCTALVALVALYAALNPDFSTLRRQQLDGTLRYKYDRLIADYDIPSGGEYILVTRDDDKGFLLYLTQYLLWPQKLIIQTEDELNLDDLSDVDCIIVFDESEKTKSFLSELSPGYTEPVYYLY